jgi:hypothetical protein
VCIAKSEYVCIDRVIETAQAPAAGAALLNIVHSMDEWRASSDDVRQVKWQTVCVCYE